MATAKPLTNPRVKAAKPKAKPYELADSGCPGLSLRVEVSGSRFWTFRYKSPSGDGRPRLPLGAYPAVSLASARAQAEAARGEVRNGADPAKDRKRVTTSGTIAAAIASYEVSIAARLEPSTVRTYTSALRRLELWCDRSGIVSLDDLDRVALAALRDYLVSVTPFEALDASDKRRKRTRARSRHTVNGELRVIKGFLANLRRQGRLKQFDSDAICDLLKAFRADKPSSQHLKPKAIGSLLASALRHDGERYDATRDELRSDGPTGETSRYHPIAPFIAFLLGTGLRRGEALGLTWDQVDLDALDSDGRTVGEINLSAATTKTKAGRIVGLEVSPSVRALLVALKLRADGPHVFGDLSPGICDSTAQRLKSHYGAPRFSYQILRKTCSTYLTCAPSIYHGASSWMSAKQLGQSVAVAEKYYAGQIRGISREARTLEAAMGCEAEFAEVLEAVKDAATPIGLSVVG